MCSSFQVLEPFIFNSKLLWAIEQTREIYKQNQIRVQQIREIIEEEKHIDAIIAISEI